MLLVTGAAGYLGSHAVVALHDLGLPVVGIDNYSRSRPAVIDAMAERIGERPRIEQLDLRDTGGLRDLFESEPIDAVIHFAGFKSVAESVADPVSYIANNVGGSVSLCEAMEAAGVRKLVFSSSCTVYGEPAVVPVDESATIRPVSPYGSTKAVIESLLAALCVDARWSVVALRYFNPVGADPSGLIGEDPSMAPTTLVPNIMAVAAGNQDRLQVFGDDHPTRDGSCVRDFIHVSDVIDAHLAALTFMSEMRGFEAFNIGTGVGTSVLEMVQACEEAVGRDIPVEFAVRRDGDASEVFACPDRAREVLGWSAHRTVSEMARDHWRFHSQHSHGYVGEPAVYND
jgi:UDP-glucose 4-epimerase